MQRDISIQPTPTTLNPLKDAVGVESVDFGTQFNGLVKKLIIYKILSKKVKLRER